MATLHVGITGGIGSGKTVASRLFEVLGIPVYYADAEAKRLMQEDATLRAQLITAFGKEVYNEEGLNRSWLATQVFGNAGKLALLNSLVHPAVIAHGQQWSQQQTAPYTLKEAALIFESGSSAGLDVVIGVWAPQALRIKRVMHRDGISRQEVLARMHKQMDEGIKMKLCDYVLYNDEQQMLIPQVLALHEQLLAMSGSI